MKTFIIEENSPQAQGFIEYVRTLPFVRMVEEKKKSFEEACVECNAVPLETFIDELRTRVKQHYADAKG